jgi:hypothetical protein
MWRRKHRLQRPWSVFIANNVIGNYVYTKMENAFPILVKLHLRIPLQNALIYIVTNNDVQQLAVMNISCPLNGIFTGVRGRIQRFPNSVDNKINTRWEATQRVMAAKLTRLTHKIAVLAPGGQFGNFWIHPRMSSIYNTILQTLIPLQQQFLNAMVVR